MCKPVMMASKFHSALSDVLSEHGVRYQLRDEQKECLELICDKKKHVFALLPTGYGKSDIYAWAPLVFSKVNWQY